VNDLPVLSGLANVATRENTPVTLASSTTHTQGARSLAVSVNGWTEVTSLDLSSMGSVASSFSFDLRLPQTVSWGDTHLAAAGLGSYIAAATDAGDYPRIVLGIAVMAVFVTVFNRLVWRPLYAYAERRLRIL